MDRCLPRRRSTDAFVRLVDLSGGAEHAARSARFGPRIDIDDPPPVIREGNGGGDGHPARFPFVCHPADRLSDGTLWTGRPRAALGGRLPRRVGEALSRDLVNPFVIGHGPEDNAGFPCSTRKNSKKRLFRPSTDQNTTLQVADSI